MNELAKTGFAVTLSFEGELQFGPSQRASALRQKVLPFRDKIAGALGLERGLAPFIKMEGGLSEELIASDAVALKRSRIARLENDTVVFVDGERHKYDLVLFCTGYRPVLKHLGEAEIEALEMGETPWNSRFHSIGLDGGRTSRSRFLRGIREDAVFVADAICKRK